MTGRLAGLVAQILASISVFVVSVVAARSMSPREFGEFSLFLGLLILLIGVGRAMTAEVVLFEETHHPQDTLVAMVLRAARSNVALGVGAGVILLIVFMLAGADTWAFAAIGVAVVPLAAQDHLRVLLPALGRGGVALAGELTYLSVVVGLLMFVDPLSTASLLVIMGCAGLVGCAVDGVGLLAPTRSGRGMVLPAPGAALPARLSHSRGAPYVAEFLMGNLAIWGSIYVVALIEGLVASGAVRGAQVLVAPFLLLGRSVVILLAGRARRLVAEDQLDALRRLGWVLGSCMACLTMVGALLVRFLPEAWLGVALGDVANVAQPLVVFAGIVVAASTFEMGPGLVLRARGHVRRAASLRARLIPVQLGALLLGTALGGAAGSQVGAAAAETARAAGNLRIAGMVTRRR